MLSLPVSILLATLASSLLGRFWPDDGRTFQPLADEAAQGKIAAWQRNNNQRSADRDDRKLLTVAQLD
jgi:hypothetical protein